MAEADLSLAKSAPATVVAGQQLTYTLTATNLGPYSDTGVTIVNPLPAGTTFQSAGGQGTATDWADSDSEHRQPGGRRVSHEHDIG